MRIEFKKGKRNYVGILADDAHLSVNNTDELMKYQRYTMGLICNGNAIGTGDLMRWRGHPNNEYLQTESTALRRGFRKKGHGIILYIFLIEAARMLGAKRIYSSCSLNRLSRRMWSEKLAQIYDVQKIRDLCRYCHRPYKKGRKPTFYIQLNGSSV